LIQRGAENVDMFRRDVLRYASLKVLNNLGERFKNGLTLRRQRQQPDALVIRRYAAQQVALLFQLRQGSHQRRQFNALHLRQLAHRDVIPKLVKLHHHRPARLG
jgi:hypothetical protein